MTPAAPEQQSRSRQHREAAATPGQAAWEAFAAKRRADLGDEWYAPARWGEDYADTRKWEAAWEAAAQAAIAAQQPPRERQALEEIARAAQGCIDGNVAPDLNWITETALRGLGWLLEYGDDDE